MLIACCPSPPRPLLLPYIPRRLTLRAIAGGADLAVPHRHPAALKLAVEALTHSCSPFPFLPSQVNA